MAEAEKALGNEKFGAGDYKAAITHFTNAINLEPTHVLYSNRSACYCALRKYAAAQTPATACHP
jgi:Flp pilus assembly protein TadD